MVEAFDNGLVGATLVLVGEQPSTRSIADRVNGHAAGRMELTVDRQYTAIIKRENDWWIGWIEEVPGINCQERTREELLQTLRITLKEALALNRQDALSAAGPDFQEEKIAV